MGNFCTNCGNKLRKDDNYCTNCGTKVDKSDIKENNKLFKSVKDKMEKEKIRMAEEIEEERKRAEAKEKEERIKAKAKEREMKNRKIERNERVRGGYCSLNCRHCYEEFFDSGGGIVGDFDSGGYSEYYCRLGHRISYGSFCEDYE